MRQILFLVLCLSSLATFGSEGKRKRADNSTSNQDKQISKHRRETDLTKTEQEALVEFQTIWKKSKNPNNIDVKFPCEKLRKLMPFTFYQNKTSAGSFDDLVVAAQTSGECTCDKKCQYECKKDTKIINNFRETCEQNETTNDS
ncbi:MAG: hypothetical protein CMP11_05110 [Zetaproteobacteria bacterium]|nr:hypothetical protein [Pseudobdellovibrionaceae bacterium]|tara:strand:+ start:144 stop:575 length:432 start_codon:yes stop_codon:yes gene_type:complete